MSRIRLLTSDHGRDLKSLARRMMDPVVDRATRLHAMFLVRRYGDAAAQRAFDRAQTFAAMGDYWGREMWLRVARAAESRSRVGKPRE